MRKIGSIVLLLVFFTVSLDAQTKTVRIRNVVGVWNFTGSPTESFTLLKVNVLDDKHRAEVVLKMKESDKEMTYGASYSYYKDNGSLYLEFVLPSEKDVNQEEQWEYEFKFNGKTRFYKVDEKYDMIESDYLEKEKTEAVVPK